jgi:cyclopropane fatty-acyl-phospholipid synthase-like methyltransferase
LGGPICYLSRTYGCNAIGVDACLQNVEISKERARSLKLEQKISFLFGGI